jgi:hypothetical protein
MTRKQNRPPIKLKVRKKTQMPVIFSATLFFKTNTRATMSYFLHPNLFVIQLFNVNNNQNHFRGVDFSPLGRGFIAARGERLGDSQKGPIHLWHAFKHLLPVEHCPDGELSVLF